MLLKFWLVFYFSLCYNGISSADSLFCLFWIVTVLTTYLTIDSLGAHGNNGYKTAEEDFSWSGNGYKKPFAVERTFPALFGTQRSWVQIPSPRPSSSRPIGCKGKAQRVEVFQPAVFLLGFGRNCLLIRMDFVYVQPVIMLEDILITTSIWEQLTETFSINSFIKRLHSTVFLLWTYAPYSLKTLKRFSSSSRIDGILLCISDKRCLPCLYSISIRAISF